MPTVVLRFEVDLDGTATELERLQHPPFSELEGVLLTTLATTEARVHVETGHLKASGHPTSEAAGDVWSGTLNYDRYPGIFELARGPNDVALRRNRNPRPAGPPRLNEGPKLKEHHAPRDSHFFFDPVQAPGNGDYDVEHGEGYKMYTETIMSWLEG
jgi:hypothetical protein